MTKILSTWLVSGLALAFAAWLLGTKMAIGDAPASLTDRAIAVALVAAVFTAVHTVIGSVVKLLAFPLVILTLGLATLVINAILLLLTASITEAMNLAPFHIESFSWAIAAAFVVSLAQSVLGLVIDRQ